VGVKTNAHRVLVGKPEETAWKILVTGNNNIKMNLKVELIHVARNRYRISPPIRRTMIFSLEILEKQDDECILILVIY
jgi:hypothetical protein